MPTATSDAKFTTPQFAPILEETDSNRIANSTAGQGGLLSHIGVINGGTGYTSTTTVSVTIAATDGSSINTSAYTFLPIISGNGVIERIEMQFSPLSGDTGSLSYWQNPIKGTAKSATVVINDANQPAGAQQATAFALISPSRGYATSGIDILPSWFVGCIAEFQGNEGGDAQALKFRQVSLLKNFIRTEDNEDPQTLSSYDALKYFDVTSAQLSGVSPGDVLSQASGAKFYFDAYDQNIGNGRVYYHQNTDPEVNFLDPKSGGGEVLIHEATGQTVSGQVNADGTTGIVAHDAEYGHRNSNSDFNGKVIFHENRIPFQRAATQTEEVKLIIQL